MKLLLRKLHHYLFLFISGLWYLVLWLPLNYFAQKPSRYNGMIRTRRIWAFLSSLCVGIIYKFEFEEPIDFSKPYIICPLHTSNLDTSMICLLMPNANYAIMGKHELLDGMVTGIFFRTIDIPVNRDSKISSFRAFKAAADKVTKGKSLVMFPEGGIADTYPPLVQEFKSGPFRMAIDLQVPVIPVTSLNTWKILWDDGFKYGSKPGICKIFVHKPIFTSGLAINNTDELRAKIRGTIISKFNESNLAS